MKKLLQFLSIGWLSATVTPVISACNEKSVFTEFKDVLKTKLMKNIFNIYESSPGYRIASLKEKALSIINQLNKEEKYNFKFQDPSVILFGKYEFYLFFFFYKEDEKNIFSTKSNVESFSMLLPFMLV